LLLDGEAEALTRKAIELALDGDASALRLCIARIVPPRRGRPVNFGLPAMRGAADLAATMAAITTSAGQGMITPGEAAALARDGGPRRGARRRARRSRIDGRRSGRVGRHFRSENWRNRATFPGRTRARFRLCLPGGAIRLVCGAERVLRRMSISGKPRSPD